MELHLSKGSHSSRDFSMASRPSQLTQKSPQVAGCAVAICHVGSALAQGFLYHTPVMQHRLAQTFISLYIYICIFIYVYIYTCILITTAPTSLGLKTVGEVLPQKTYRPRIK